jgi:hypothetical protein
LLNSLPRNPRLRRGLYSFRQSLKEAQPSWLTGVLLAVVIPLIFQVLEYLLHWFRGTPHLHVAAIVSLIVSSLSALFNWYAMCRGTLLVGGEGGSFSGDLLRLPRLFSVSCSPSRKIATKVKSRSLQFLTGLWMFSFLGGRVLLKDLVTTQAWEHVIKFFVDSIHQQLANPGGCIP